MRLGRAEFYEAVTKAARRGDKDVLPEVAEGARYLRERVFEPLKTDAQKLGLLPDLQKEAQEAAEKAAVDDYVRVESGQIYGDYAALAKRQVLTRADFRSAVRRLYSEPGDFTLPEAEGAANAIRDLYLQRAMGVRPMSKAARRGKIEKILMEAYSSYSERTSPLSREKFRARAEKAMRGTVDTDPDVLRMSRLLSDETQGRILPRLGSVKAAPVDLGPVGAESYVMRLYDRNKIRANRAEWDEILTTFFQGRGRELAEARSIAEEVTRRILGTDKGIANFNAAFGVPDAGPLHERTLPIRDELIEKFLDNDPVKVAHRYVRELAPQIETVRQFGDKDMSGAMQAVRDEYDVLRERVRSDPAQRDHARALDDLSKEENRVVQALTRVRDRVHGRAGILSPMAGDGQRALANVLRGWRNIVLSAKLGGTALTGGVNDLSRIVAQYGFTNTMGKLTKLAASPDFRRMSMDNARRIGAAVEVALARRVMAATDGAITDGWTQKLAESTFKLSGLNHITDFWRTLAATLIEDKIIQAADDVVAGRPLARLTQTRLARIGLDTDALRRIHQQVSQHGADLDGVRVSGSITWTDGALAENYELAVLRESRIVVMQPGAADRTWWADSEVGKTLGQIKSFVLAAPTRLVMEPAQLVGQGEYLQAARFVGSLMVGGYLAHSLRQLLAGKEPVTEPGGAAAEAFAESGLGGIIPEIVSPFARRFGLFGESARFSDRNVTSTFGGPAVGTFADAYDILYNRSANGLSARDLHAVRRLIPMQNIWWLRRSINALEGETAEAMGLEGATTQSFGERLMETAPLKPTAERGATGTGSLY